MGKRVQPKKESKMETQIEVKKKGELTNASDLSAWGKREINTTSVVIPRILKMEFMSDMVKQQKAKFGELRDSLTGDLIGDITKGLQIVPIEVEEKWLIFNLVKSKGKTDREFSEVVPVTSANENWKYAEDDVERDRVMDVYCLLKSEIDALPKDWKERGLKPLPKIFGFRRTSLRAGKKLYTQMYITNQSKNLPPPAVVIEITGKQVDGKKGSYIELDAKPVSNATPEALEIAFSWYKAIKKGDAKADDRELKDVQTTSSVNADEVKDY